MRPVSLTWGVTTILWFCTGSEEADDNIAHQILVGFGAKESLRPLWPLQAINILAVG